MRTYIPHYARYGLEAARYRELRNFCLQYPTWKADAESLLGVSGQKYDAMPHGSGVSDPVARAAEKRERLNEKIQMVENCARMVDGGRWYFALIQNCCMGKPLMSIDPVLFPTSNRNAYYQARRGFFLALDAMKE